MELFSCSNVLGWVELLSRLPRGSNNTNCHGSLGTCGHGNTSWHQLEGSNPHQCCHRGCRARRGFLTAEGLCWEERKFRRMSGKEGQTQSPKAFLEDTASHLMSIAVHPERPFPGPAPSPTATVLGHSAPSVLHQGLHVAICNVLAPPLWRGQLFFPSPNAAGWWIDHRLRFYPTQSNVQETARQAGDTILPPATGSEHHFNHGWGHSCSLEEWAGCFFRHHASLSVFIASLCSCRVQ